MLMPNQHLFKSLWSLQITVTLTEGVLLIFMQSGDEKLLEIEPTTLDLGSQANANDLSGRATPGFGE